MTSDKNKEKTPGVTPVTPVGAQLLSTESAWKTVGRRSNPSPRLGPAVEEEKPRKWTGLGMQFQHAPIWSTADSLGRRPSVDSGRSASFSIGQPGDNYSDHSLRQAIENLTPEDFDPTMLAALDEDLTEEEYARMIMEKIRSARSKSSQTGTPPRKPSIRLDRRPSASMGPPPGLAYATPANRTDPNRRFSIAPATVASNAPPSAMRYLSPLSRAPITADYNDLRRHSLAGTAPTPHTASSSAAYRHLSDALDHMQLDEFRRAQYGGLAPDDVDEYFDPESRRKSIADVGKGVPLSSVPPNTPLYIVEFKAGRSDLFYAADAAAATVVKGDLVIVEADRGKDLGKVVNDSITPLQVQQLQQQQAEHLPDLHRGNKELHPKRIYRLAQPAEVAMLVSKSQDELKALASCQTKVRAKKLPMEVVDAEYQWDRRKLTFYFVADRRIDFRELVRELFKVYKTRIWMCAVNPDAATGAVPGKSEEEK